MTGASLVPEVTQGACDRDREMVSELKFSPRDQENLRALIGRRYKLVEDVQRGILELFDLSRGGREGKRVTTDRPSLLARMRDRLRDWAEVESGAEIRLVLSRNVVDRLPPEAQTLRARFEGGVEIVGADLGPARIAANETLPIKVYLRLTRRQRGSLAVRYRWPNQELHWFPNRHLPADILGSAYWPQGKLIVDDPQLRRLSTAERGRRLPVEVGLERNGDPVMLEGGGEWATVGEIELVRWSVRHAR